MSHMDALSQKLDSTKGESGQPAQVSASSNEPSRQRAPMSSLAAFVDRMQQPKRWPNEK